MKPFVLLAILFGSGLSAIFATPLCTSVGTAAVLEALGQTGCQFGDKIFYGFTYTYNLQNVNGDPFDGDVGTPNVAGTSVVVQFSNLGDQPWAPVLSLISNWQVSDGNSGDVRVHYDVWASSAAGAMYYSWLAAYGSVSNVDPDAEFSSVISIAESVCCPGGSALSLGVTLQAPEAVSPLTATTGFDQTYYASSTQITFDKDIFIQAGTGTNRAILIQVDQGLFELTAVPEPVEYSLFGSILLVIGLICRRKGRLNGRHS